MESFNENTKEIGKAVGKAKTPPRDPRKTPPADPWFRNDELEDLIAKMKAVWDSTWKHPAFSLFAAQKDMLNRHLAEFGAETVFATWEWLCTCDDDDEARSIRKKWKGLRTFLKPENICNYIQAHQEYLQGDVEGKQWIQNLTELTEQNRLESVKKDAKIAAEDAEHARKKAENPDYLTPAELIKLWIDFMNRTRTNIEFHVFSATRPDVAMRQKFLEERANFKPTPEGEAELDKLRRLIAEEKAKKEDKSC